MHDSWARKAPFSPATIHREEQEGIPTCSRPWHLPPYTQAKTQSVLCYVRTTMSPRFATMISLMIFLCGRLVRQQHIEKRCNAFMVSRKRCRPKHATNNSPCSQCWYHIHWRTIDVKQKNLRDTTWQRPDTGQQHHQGARSLSLDKGKRKR